MLFGHTVALGPILPVDVPRLFQWADDAEDAQLNEPYRPLNWHQQEGFWLNAERDPTRAFFAIRSHEAAGIIGYVQIGRIEPIHRSASIGIRIDRAERGEGKGREALRLAIDYCWNHLNLTRLTLSVFAGNEAAIGLYAKVGFREEGRLKAAQFIAGRWIDVILMALHHPDRPVAAPADGSAVTSSPTPVCR